MQKRVEIEIREHVVGLQRVGGKVEVEILATCQQAAHHWAGWLGKYSQFRRP